MKRMRRMKKLILQYDMRLDEKHLRWPCFEILIRSDDSNITMNPSRMIGSFTEGTSWTYPFANRFTFGGLLAITSFCSDLNF